MQHCLKFKPSDIWFLFPSEEFSERRISIGFCPICGVPVAELWQFKKSGVGRVERFTGVNANNICEKLKSQIEFKGSGAHMAKMRGKAYGWIYGVNKVADDGETIEQIAKDFYGNAEVVRKVKS